MRNTLLVIKHEIVSTLSKPSFWLMTVLFPLVVIGMQLGGQSAASDFAEEREADITPGNQAIGYVDEAGLIEIIPEFIPLQLFLVYPDEAAARVGLENGDISGYYLIPSDYVASGELVLVTAEYNPLINLGNDLIEYVLTVNLTGDEAAAQLVSNPLGQATTVALAPEGGAETEGPLAFAVPYATLFIFFFIISTTSGFILQSVAKEKENRVVEVLLVSLRPRGMMLGKVVGMGVVGLLQMALWVSGGIFALSQSGASELTSALELPPGFVVWALLFFVLGYLLYSSVMAGLGAMAPTMREGQQFTFLVLLPLMIPVFLMNAFIQTPNSALVTFLSLFPLTSPVSMITRLILVSVPIWQLVLSLLLLALTSYLVAVFAARLFRAQTLLSGATLTRQRVWQVLRGD
jgi:ABC-2 type transport system permease protein